MPPKKKKISGYINLQIEVARPPRSRSTRSVSGVNIMGSSRRTTRRPSTSAAASSPSSSRSTKTAPSTSSPRRPRRRAIKEPRVSRKGGRRAAQGQGRQGSPKDQVREIAEVKMPDLNANDIDAAMKIIIGTARQMGITTEL